MRLLGRSQEELTEWKPRIVHTWGLGWDWLRGLSSVSFFLHVIPYITLLRREGRTD